jgi:acetyl esterase/lipase
MSIEQLERLVGLIRSSPPLGDGDVAAIREATEAMGAMLPVDPETGFTAVEIGPIRAEWADAPNADAARALLYLHGGGYVSGSIAVYRSLAARLSLATGARVLVVDYRLAPEHPFPAAIEDAVRAYQWLLGLGFEPGRIAIAGDSAGGGLAAATLLSIRDAGLAGPAAAVLMSPMLDLEATGESMTTKAGEDPMVQRTNVLLSAKRYLDGADPRSPLASPLYGDLARLPPVLIQVGTAECLLDDSRRFAARARQAGVRVSIEEWEHMIHVWQLFAPMLDEGRQAIDRIGEFVRERLN